MAERKRQSIPMGRLVDTYEIGPFSIGDPKDDWDYHLRVEIWADQRSNGRYYARGWHYESYRIQSTFPQDENTGLPLDSPSDELVILEDCLILDMEVEASSPGEILDKILTMVEEKLI